ncbi:MAG: choice-of-anchor J domain-containing protein [Flavobacteriales bacterium]|nr:choice-of-anchor J domain-containing protein [Flavobacteriales bacterium]
MNHANPTSPQRRTSRWRNGLLGIAAALFMAPAAFAQCGVGESELSLTTSGGSYASEKWVNITTGANGTGTVIWAQGNGTYGNGAGLVTGVTFCVTNGSTYYINCYDTYADGWDGTVYSITAGPTVVANNGGVSPDDGTDTDASYLWNNPPPSTVELESSEAFSYTPPACPPPSSLGVTALNASGADLGWTESGTATAWDLEIGAGGFSPTGTPMFNDVGANPYTWAGGSANMPYDFYVRADCNSDDIDVSAWSGPYSFFTGYCTPAPTSVDNQGIVRVVFSTVDNNTVGTSPEAGNYADFSAMVGNIAQSTTVNVDITYQTGYTYETEIWVDWNDDLDFDDVGENVYSGVSTSSNPTTLNATFAVGTNPLGNHRMRIGGGDNAVTSCYTGSYASFEDYTVNVTAPPACVAPSALSAINATTTGADLGWTENGSATAWDIEIGVAPLSATGVPTLNDVGTNPYTWSGGAAATTYEFYVRADCNSDDIDVSTWTGPFSFTTPCAVYTPDYNEDFATFLPNCWDEATSGTAATGPTGIGSGSWTNSTVLGTGSARINLYGTSQSDWLLSPLIDLSAGGYEVVVDVAVTNWNSGAADAMGSDDVVNLLYTEDGITWISVATWTAADALPNTPTAFSYALASTGSTVQFGILATDGPTDDSEDYDFHVDNFQVRTPPACPAPSALGATNETASGADLNWTENGTATAWDIEIGATPFSPTGTPTLNDVGANPYTWAGGAAATTYEYYVRADCNMDNVDVSTWQGPFSFTTLCATFTAPYHEGFDVSSSNPPGCWSISAGAGDGWRFNGPTGFNTTCGAPGNGSTGTGSFAWIDLSSPADANVLLNAPLVDVSALTNPQLRFDRYMCATSNAPNPLYVEYYDGAVWQLLQSFTTGTATTGSNAAGWQEEIVNLSSAVSGGIVQIRFRGEDGGGPSSFNGDVGLDEIYFEEAPACPAPTALSATNVTSSGADLGWTENGSASAWDIEIGANGFTPTGTPTLNDVGANPYTWAGGAANTAYDFYVRADCGMDNVDVSAWVGPYSFNTLCNAFTVPFQEGFNSTSPTQACWTVLNVNADGDSWNMDYTGYAYEGDQSAGMYTDFNGGNNDDWLISPAITLTGAEQLRYWYRVRSSSEPNDMEVLLSTTGTAPGDFTNTLLPLTAYNNTTYAEQTIMLTAFSGNVHIAWRVPPGGLDGYYIYVDDVNVELAPTCPAPSALGATNVTSLGADLGWTENGSATAWDIEIGTNGFTPTGTPTLNDVGTNPYTWAGGSANTAYDFYVRADCGMDNVDVSGWTGPYSFTTLCGAANVPYTEDFNGASTPAMPNCWSVENVNGSNTWITTSFPSIFGTTAARYPYNSSFAADDWMFSQGINLVGGTEYTLSYEYGANGYDESLEVYYGTSATSAAMTNLVVDNGTFDDGPHAVSYSITPAIGGVYYFGWHAYSIANQFNLEVDNISVIETPACPVPTAVSVSGTTHNSTNVNFTCTACTGSIIVEYGPAGYTPGTGAAAGATGTLVSSTATSPQAISGLSGSTSYDVYVRQDCSGSSNGYSNNSAVTNFTTPAAPPANDLCANAIMVGANSVTPGYTTNGTTIDNPGFCTTSLSTGPGVWYTVQGIGGMMTADLCGASYDTKIGIFTGTCGSLTCLQGNDDDLGTNGAGVCGGGTRSSTSWVGYIGTTYYIYVTGFSTNSGTFNLTMNSVPGVSAVVAINTDSDPGQLSWEFTNASNTVIATGGPTVANGLDQQTVLLSATPVVACYGFKLMDSFGDGILGGNWQLRTTGGKVLLGDDFAGGADSPSTTPQYWAYGTHHGICLPEGPANIAPTECGIMNNTLLNKVYCNKVTGATKYQFEFADPDAGYIRRIARNRNYIVFQEMQAVPLTPGVKYFARVRTDRDGPMVSAHFGAGCEMGLGVPQVVPCTELIQAPAYGHSCNETRAFNTNNSFIYAQPVVGGTEYQFRLINTQEGYDQTFIRNTYILQLKWNNNVAPMLVDGYTYNVQINVKVNGLESGFCASACNITIDNSGNRPEASMTQANFGNATLWPNPVRESQVNLSIDGIQDADQQITVDIQDIYGKQVLAKEFGNSGERFNTIMDLPSDIANGIYMVNITVNGKNTVKRLSIIR